MTDAAPSAFETAVTSQRHLESALTGAGFDVDREFALMTADVDGLGEPRVNLGPVSTTTADRLSAVIDGGGSIARR
jgi:hypothetical protein